MQIRLLSFLLLSLLARFSQAQVGIGTTTPQAFFNVAQGKDVLFGERLDNTGNRNKLIWYAEKGALRAGRSSTDDWSPGAQIGIYSLATGLNTKASSQGSTAMGGWSTASGNYATAIGFTSNASGEASTALGNYTTAKGNYATATGYYTNASGEASTAMGFYTNAQGKASTAIGTSSDAIGDYSTAMGTSTTASGLLSTALGNHVSTNDKVGSFIIGDNNTNVYNNSADNQMMMRFAGGYILYTSSGPFSPQTSIGVQLAPNSNAWSTVSDSTRKEHFRYADGASFLQKISTLRLGSWNYKGQDTKRYRHYGPMAQDFFAAFGHDGLGVIGNEKSINQADFDGVNLIAIQALIKKVEKLEAEHQDLQAEKKAVRAETASIKADLEQLRTQVTTLLKQ